MDGELCSEGGGGGEQHLCCGWIKKEIYIYIFFFKCIKKD